MAVELDMPVAHFVDRDLSDGRAVDERRRRNENLAAEIDGNRMPGRQKKVLRRAVGAECVDGDPDRIDRRRAGVGPAVDVSMTDPLDRSRFAGRGQDKIPDLQVLDDDFAFRPADKRTRNEARNRHDRPRPPEKPSPARN